MLVGAMRRALVVEDDPDIVELIEHYLKAEGFRVDSVDDGRAALDRLRAESYEVLLLDLQLPGLDGLRLCAEVRRDRRTHNLPVIMLTAKEFALLVALLRARGRVLSRQTLLENLVDNAVKYTPEGGRVEVVCTSGPDGGATVLVVDNGPGIPAERLPRIFERFYRVDKARSRELGGTGLGLAIVKHLAEGMGAFVSVESTPGRGTRFTVSLPLRRERG